MVSPARAREEVARVVRVHAVTQRWAIKILGVKRSTIRYSAPSGRVRLRTTTDRGGDRHVHPGEHASLRIPAHHHRAGEDRLAGEHQACRPNHAPRGLLRPPKQRPRPAPGLSNNSISKLPAPARERRVDLLRASMAVCSRRTLNSARTYLLTGSKADVTPFAGPADVTPFARPPTMRCWWIVQEELGSVVIHDQIKPIKGGYC